MSVSGVWTLNVYSDWTPDPFELRLTEGSAGGLTGSMALQDNPAGQVPLMEGRVSGSSISWKVRIQQTFAFSGSVDGEKITGTVKVASLSFEFLATHTST